MVDDDSGTVALATEAAIDASQAEASAQAAAESALVATAVAAGSAAVAEQEAAVTVASYEERLNECHSQISSLQTSLAAERQSRDDALNALRAEIQETHQLIQSALAENPEPNPESQPEAVPGEAEVTTPEKTDQPSAAEEKAAEPEPVKERRRAHRWI